MSVLFESLPTTYHKHPGLVESRVNELSNKKQPIKNKVAAKQQSIDKPEVKQLYMKELKATKCNMNNSQAEELGTQEPTVETPSKQQFNEKLKKMDSLDSIQVSTYPLLRRIESAKGGIEEKEFLYLQDQLERCHIALDNVQVDGDEEVRKKRKSIAVHVSNILNILDAKATPKDCSIKEKSIHKQSDQKKIKECDYLQSYNNHLEIINSEKNIMKENESHLNSEGEMTSTISNVDSKGQIEVNSSHKNNCETIHSTDKENIDSNRIKMEVSENFIILEVDIRDKVKNDPQIRFEGDTFIVTVRNGNRRAMMRKTLPSGCLVNKAASHLNSDGYMVVKVPRRR